MFSLAIASIRRMPIQLWLGCNYETSKRLNFGSLIFSRDVSSRSLNDRRVKQICRKPKKKFSKKSSRSSLGRSSLAFSQPSSEEHELSSWVFQNAQQLFKKQLREMEEADRKTHHYWGKK